MAFIPTTPLVGNVVGKVPIFTKLVPFPTNIFVGNGENSCSEYDTLIN
jgi:hypothetical protein